MRSLRSWCQARTALFLALTALLDADGAMAQPAAMVADINTVREDFADALFASTPFATLGTTVFFVHTDGIHGYELWKTDGTAAGTAMVRDLCPGTCWSRPVGLTVFGGALFFLGDDGVHGRELWRTDGTAAGTSMVLDLKPGLGAGAGDLRIVGGILYLAADDGVHGQELWKTDGTAAGTAMVQDVNPGAAGSAPFLWLDTGDKLLFAADDGVHGIEPWLSDGTAAGTTLLKDIFPGGAQHSSLFGNPVSSEMSAASLGGGAFLFLATDGVQGLEIWKSDGTAAGTTLLKDINPGSYNSSAYGFTPVGSRIVFAAEQGGSEGFELWATDGTEAGTSRLKDIRPGPLNSSPRGFTVFNGQAYFIASSDTAGRELWRTDGTEAGTVLVADIHPGAGDAFSPFVHFTLREAAGSLFFFAADGVHGIELWKSDGTTGGTTLVKDVEPGPESGFGFGYSGLTAVGGTLFFHGFTSGHGLEIWKSDGTEAGTQEVKNIAALTSSLAWWNGFGRPAFPLAGGQLLLDADDGVSGFEPWVTDGTAAGTQRLGDLAPGPDWSSPSVFQAGANQVLVTQPGELWATDGTPAGTSRIQPGGPLLSGESFGPALGSLYFGGRDTTSGYELWKTDGTSAGTVELNEINPGANSSYPHGFTEVGSTVLFHAYDGSGWALWRTAGTSPTTFALTFTAASELTPLGTAALFVTDFPGSGAELCRTDGTLPGTVLLKDIRPGADSSSPSQLTRAGSLVFFFADDGASGTELWKSDGTEAGTVPVEDIHPGSASSQGRIVAVLGSRVVFVADDGAAGAEPWVSDGTAAGTFLLKDVFPGARSSEVEEAVVGGGRLYFVANDGVHGRELWTSDGTAAGTRLVIDLVSGPGSPVIRNVTAVGHLAIFSADNGVHGREMWRSNGSSVGTRRIHDIAPGPLHSSPGGFTALGDQLYFAANDNTAGFELWKAPLASVLTTFYDVPPTHWAWRFVEALAIAGITNGCGGGGYCPSSSVTRATMAVFLERGLHGPGFVPPPATGAQFIDVPADYWAAAWIEQLAADGVTTGCGGGRYCPDALVTRAQMAIFLLRAEHGSSYIPPPATGTRFLDVPPGYWAAAWIEQLAAEGITAGCTADRYCPDGLVTRNQMAVFLARTYKLALP